MKGVLALLILVYALLAAVFGFAPAAVPFSVLVLALLWAAAFEPGGAAEQRRLTLKQLQALEDLRRELYLMRVISAPARGMTAVPTRRQP